MHPFIRLATPRDISLLTKLQRAESGRLGFITYKGLVDRIERHRVYVGLDNGEAAAFALFDVNGRGATIHQTAAMADVRRRHLGIALSNAVRAAAGRRGASIVRLCCGVDMGDAVAFWRAAGFESVAVRPGGTSRKRDLVLFEAPATETVQPDLITPPKIQAYSAMVPQVSAAQAYGRRTIKSRSRLDQPDDPLFSLALKAWDGEGV